MQDQPKDSDRFNRHLASRTRGFDPRLGREYNPYPIEEERERINAAFEHLLSVLREGSHLEKALRALPGVIDPDLSVIPIG